MSVAEVPVISVLSASESVPRSLGFISFKMLLEVVGGGKLTSCEFEHQTEAGTMLGMYSKGSFRGGIGAGCPGTRAGYDHKGSSAGRVS